jgi:hypothetical protein
LRIRNRLSLIHYPQKSILSKLSWFEAVQFSFCFLKRKWDFHLLVQRSRLIVMSKKGRKEGIRAIKLRSAIVIDIVY